MSERKIAAVQHSRQSIPPCVPRRDPRAEVRRGRGPGWPEQKLTAAEAPRFSASRGLGAAVQEFSALSGGRRTRRGTANPKSEPRRNFRRSHPTGGGRLGQRWHARRGKFELPAIPPLMAENQTRLGRKNKHLPTSRSAGGQGTCPTVRNGSARCAAPFRIAGGCNPLWRLRSCCQPCRRLRCRVPTRIFSREGCSAHAEPRRRNRRNPRRTASRASSPPRRTA